MLRKLSDEESRSLEDSLAQNGVPFENQEEAEKHFFTLRDNDLAVLQKLNLEHPDLRLDFKAQSLKRLESFYFDCYIDNKITIQIPKDEFELLLSQYMRQVFVSNDMAEWMVFENDFAEGRYELGILYGYGSGGSEHYADGLSNREDNKARTFLYDRFMLYVPAEREKEVQ